ncbi:hypothetical protein [uncultured Flavobacterium sp.]|uniref:hypothetical protein n=1 Tax=uncultured Flavobacterium sp. TaxID=165435 RepID=UPI0030EE7ABE
MLAVLFAVCYQSLHAFSHSVNDKFDHNHSHSKSEKNLVYKVSEKENCPVCDFKFAAFLSPEIFTFQFIPFYQNVRYLFSIPENIIAFSGSLYSLRGPPSFI